MGVFEKSPLGILINKAVAWLEAGLASFVRWIAALAYRRMTIYGRTLATAPYRGATVVAPIFLVACVPLVLSPAVALNTWQLDYSLPLDTSMRWVFGHIPHIDFETPIGVAYWLAQGWATELIGIDVRTPVLANLIAAVPLAIGATLLLARRLSGALLGIFVLAVLLLAVSPRAVGDLPGEVSFLAGYNKVGLAIFCVLVVAFFLEPTRPGRRGVRVAEVATVAFFLVWLVYLKITFAVIAVAGGIVAFHYAPANRGTILLGFAIMVATVLVVGWSTGINGPYLEDIMDAARASPTFRARKLMLDIGASRLSLVLIALSTIYYWKIGEASRSMKISDLVVAMGLLFASAIAMNQVHDNYFPLGFAALFVLAQRSLAHHPEPVSGYSASPIMAPFVPPLVGATLLVAFITLSDVYTVTHYYRAGQENSAGARMCDQLDQPICGLTYLFPKFDSGDRLTPLPGPLFTNATEPAGGHDALLTIAEMIDYCSANDLCLLWKLNQQLYQLLNRHMSRQDRPYYFGFTNILPYYYQVEPPKYVMAWTGMGRNFSQESHPLPARMFSDITLVAMPKVNFGVGRAPGLHTIYEDELPNYFSKVDETEAWIIWRRPDTRATAGR